MNGIDRGVVLEADALLRRLVSHLADGDRERFDRDDSYRWVVHRLWIAIGNEAARVEAVSVRPEPWRSLRLFRNMLAHTRLVDIDEDIVWRTSVLRPPDLLDHLAALWA